jgi:hypothetical protein
MKTKRSWQEIPKPARQKVLLGIQEPIEDILRSNFPDYKESDFEDPRSFKAYEDQMEARDCAIEQFRQLIRQLRGMT